jgi:hypothetical protein
MSRAQQIAFLQADLHSIEHQLQSLGDRPTFKRIGLTYRQQQIQRELTQSLAWESHLASGELTFSGSAVIGTRAIKASFAAVALSGFEKVVSITAATRNAPTAVNTRGSVAGQRDQQLFVTDIARGSFGFRLEEPEPELVNGQQELPIQTPLAEAMDSVLAMMEAGADTSDERFADAVLETNNRVRSALREFAETLVKAQTTCAFSTNGKRFRFSEVQQIEQLRDRLAEENVTQERVNLTGILYTLPSGHRFELVDDNHETWSGRADRAIDAQILASFTTKRVTIEAEKSVVRRQGLETKKLLLLEIQPADQPTPAP